MTQLDRGMSGIAKHSDNGVYGDRPDLRSTVVLMQTTLRRNAVLVSGLAMFFWWGFMFAKHDALLRPIIPFGDDPYDAVSSFAAIAVVLLAMLSFTRAFFPNLAGRSGRPIYILRAQAAIPLCVLFTVAVETVAMARHIHSWLGMPGTARLLALQTALIVFSLVALSLTRDTRAGGQHLSTRAAIICVASLLILSVYPEHLISSVPGHLLTVLLGDVLLFAPVSALVRALLPSDLPSELAPRTDRRATKRFKGFAVAAVIGVSVGVAAYAGEIGEDRTFPAIRQLFFVGGVYLGLGLSGLVIAYACLGKVLGFGEDTEQILQCRELKTSAVDRLR